MHLDRGLFLINVRCEFVCSAPLCMSIAWLELEGEAASKRMGTDNLAGIVDLERVTQSSKLQLIPSVIYNVRKNKFMPNYPVVYTRESYKVVKGDFKRLA